jgi:hypothetical protein
MSMDLHKQQQGPEEENQKTNHRKSSNSTIKKQIGHQLQHRPK